MKFCSRCERNIKKEIVSGAVIFKCVCGNIEKTNPEDVLISNVTTTNIDTVEMYRNLIDSAPFDRTTQLIKKDCPKCGLDYLSQLRLGTAEIIVYRCKCGYEKIIK